MSNGDNKEFILSLEDVPDGDIDSLLVKFKELEKVRKKLSDIDERIRTRIRVFLKERNWDRYMDKESKISVSLITQKCELIDKTQLKYILNEGQIAQIINLTTYERLSIITPESRARLKKYVKKDYGKSKK